MSTPASPATVPHTDEPYDQFESTVRDRVAGLAGPFFTTDASPDALWDAYLAGLPHGRRKHYNCHCCRRFIQRFGGLVTVDETGVAAPAVWDVDAPPFFRAAVNAMRRLVARAKVTGVFLSPDPTWGTPHAGGWSHLAGRSPAVFADRVLDAAQAMAARREEFGMLQRGLADYPRRVVDQAVRVLRADALDRSEKTLGVTEWLADLHGRLDGTPKNRRDNLVWRAVATAPPGFCHVRSTMIATLLDDVVAGLPFADLARRWAEKMHPLRYMRPKAAPSAGAIEAAERLVEKLGVGMSLARRFATLDDVLSPLWLPPPPPRAARAGGGGFFDHLRPAAAVAAKEVDLPPTAITWERFRRTVLPDAVRIEVRVPHRGNFYGLATAADPAAPPILQWDGLDGHPRNPASLYVYNGGSMAVSWGLKPGWWAATAVFLGPHRWQEPGRFDHHGDHVHFALAGCRDESMRPGVGLCLFPEFLKAEFHGIRSVIEAHSRKGWVVGGEAATANGLLFNKGAPVTVRVRSAGGSATYTIDRLD